ncbi:hypothetical protein [Flavobacterium sp.]|uniref:hypothetical protein n=1 Tax=Flavobacterium sp. TaxID=239 RepID=UPI0031D712AF
MKSLSISKSVIFLLVLLNSVNSFCQTMTSNQTHFLKITNQFSVEDFEKVKEFILEKGNRKTYRNLDNNNPYYDFGKFESYLGADIGQQNIYNDPKLSDFNELTLKDNNNYFKILIVRKGDIQALKRGILDGMKENEIYFVDIYQTGFIKIPDSLLDYLKYLKEIN